MEAGAVVMMAARAAALVGVGASWAARTAEREESVAAVWAAAKAAVGAEALAVNLVEDRLGMVAEVAVQRATVTAVVMARGDAGWAAGVVVAMARVRVRAGLRAKEGVVEPKVKAVAALWMRVVAASGDRTQAILVMVAVEEEVTTVDTA